MVVVDLDLSRFDSRLSRVEADVTELREQLTDERIATGRLAAQVSAHEERGQERHHQLIVALDAMRADQRQASEAAAEREGRLAKIALAVIGILGTAVTGLLGAQ
jgi:CHASE3 domain sensor protein